MNLRLSMLDPTRGGDDFAGESLANLLDPGIFGLSLI
jgi:hypothetical protein